MILYPAKNYGLQSQDPGRILIIKSRDIAFSQYRLKFRPRIN